MSEQLHLNREQGTRVQYRRACTRLDIVLSATASPLRIHTQVAAVVKADYPNIIVTAMIARLNSLNNIVANAAALRDDSTSLLTPS